MISSQSTLAGIITRLAVIAAGKSRLSKRIPHNGHQVKIFHTAHGYLFHDDNNLKKWVYLLPEILCGTVTDVLMVMNHEDLEIAKKYKLCGNCNKIYYINGMGIDLSKFEVVKNAPQATINEWKKSFGIKENDFAFVYVAEFSKRKNHQLLLRGFAMAIKNLKSLENAGELPAGLSADRLKLVLAGDGILLEDTKVLASGLGITDQVLFPGYVRYIPELYACCQAAVSTSRIEGLPFNVMEAMACGLPVIASDIKGHRELVTHGENGLLFEGGNLKELTEPLAMIYLDPVFREKCKTISLKRVEHFSISSVFPNIIKIYKNNI